MKGFWVWPRKIIQFFVIISSLSRYRFTQGRSQQCYLNCRNLRSEQKALNFECSSQDERVFIEDARSYADVRLAVMCTTCIINKEI